MGAIDSLRTAIIGLIILIVILLPFLSLVLPTLWTSVQASTLPFKNVTFLAFAIIGIFIAIAIIAQVLNSFSTPREPSISIARPRTTLFGERGN